MGIEIIFAIVILLLLFAVFDIIVGVSNDAVNFINSAIGSRVAPFFVIMTVASLGILAGVTFSGGMMEVARKGIFHPQFFTMPELIIIFLAVMITDVLLLDLFNSFGLPTSTTVSIVFELLGAAVAMALLRILNTPDSNLNLVDYINTSKAMIITFGILLSIIVAFCSGAIVQFITRQIFTFDYEERLKRYGGIWGGIAMAFITFFILIKGAKGATFITPEMYSWIKTHSMLILTSMFIVSALILQVLMILFRINILKIIVLVGTFALAMAFASNDLVNFIGVPLAGLHAYQIAVVSTDPLNITMEALSETVQTQGNLLLLAGIIMVFTLWFSKKARTVSKTELSLGQQDEGTERFESIWISRSIVGMVDSMFSYFKVIVPEALREFIYQRMNPVNKKVSGNSDKNPPFDMLRASVNLMVASAIISYATSLKLPLSTTYVTFMVSMGTSFSDQAWGRESAVYRVTGVLTVIGGWFMTAFIAFVTAFLFATCISSFKLTGIIMVLIFVILFIWNNHQKHKNRTIESDEKDIFNLKKVKDSQMAVSSTFDHLSLLLKEFRESFDVTLEALFDQNIDELNRQRKKVKKSQIWINIIMANVFKVLRLRQKEDYKVSYKYAQTIRRLQKLSDGLRDIVLRSRLHVANKHKGLLEVQIDELKEIKITMLDILLKVETSFRNKEIKDYQNIVDQYNYMREMAERMNIEQIGRIQDDSSKTRLSILFYAIVGNCLMLAKQNIKLLEILNESFIIDKELSNSYAEVESN
ncbi:anion permease [Thermodesulfobacteriota bacterium]